MGFSPEELERARQEVRNEQIRSGKEVIYYDGGIRYLERQAVTHEILWGDIRLLGFWSEDTGLAITDDLFLFIQTPTLLHLFSTALAGMDGLVEYVNERFQCQYGQKGYLANSTSNDSVVSWPVEHVGKSFHDALGNAEDPIPVRYYTLH